MNRREIVFVNRFFFPDHSATSQIVSDLAFHLANRGWTVSVVTSSKLYDDPAADLPEREQVRGVDIHRLTTIRSGRAHLLRRTVDAFLFQLRVFFRLLRLLRRGTIVVAKTDPPLVSFPAAAAAAMRGARLVNWLQDLFPEVAAALGVVRIRITFRILRAIRDATLRRAATNVAIGTLMQKKLAARGIDSKVVENWADGTLIRPMATANHPLRRAWGVEEKFVVAYSGNLGRAHEVDVIADAARDLATDEQVHFLIVGGGAQLGKLRGATSDLQNISFHPYQPREVLGESLTAADVHLVSLLPRMEGLIVPSKFYGIAAAGRATIVIGSREGEIGRLVAEAGAGVVVTPDGQQLASAIRRLANDRERTAEYGAAARRLFDERYDVTIALERWRTLLEDVAQRPPHR